MIYYASGDEIRAGDQLGPGMQWSGQVSRVVVVIPTAEAVEGYVGSDWTYLETGVMIWDGESKGTLNNVLNLVQQGKSALVYLSPIREFIPVKSRQEVAALVSRCSSEAREALNRSIKLEARSAAEQSALKFG